MIQHSSKLEIDLEDKDIRDDLPGLVNAMSKIRSEAIKNRIIADEQKDEYLHLAYRLASGLEAIADENTTRRMQNIAQSLNNNPALLNYDPMQDGYWKKSEMKFIKTLEDLLIAVVKDDFHSVDPKHHVLQAIKYLGAKDSSTEEKQRVYGTIVPFHKPVLLDPEVNLFRKNYVTTTADGLILSVLVKPKNMERLIKKAKEYGYHEIQVNINTKEFEKIKGFIPRARIIETRIIETKSKDKPNYNFKRLMAKAFKYTWPISVPILGLFSYNKIRYFENYLKPELDWFQSEKALKYIDFFSMGVTSLFQGGAGALLYHYGDHNYNLPNVLSVYFSFEGFARIFFLFASYEGRLYPPSLIGLAVSKIFLDNNLTSMFKSLKNRKIPCKVAIPLEDLIKYDSHPQNHAGFYDIAARLEIPEIIENNLDYINNDIRLGIPFINYISIYTGFNLNGIKDEIDRENKVVIYSHELRVDDYLKHSSLFCFKGKRYLVTAIETAKETNDFVKNAAAILSSDSDNRQKLEKIGKSMDARYIHLKEYRKGNVISDMEGFG